jgi:predicted PolB exonuclease-like 3'-5' exonuclease
MSLFCWDIETTGFNPKKELVTVAACYTPHRQTVYQFAESDLRGNVVKIHDFIEKREAFLAELDDAPILAAFNGTGFDIPFIATAFEVDPTRVMRWMMKSFDIFEAAKRATGRTFSLNTLIGLNGFNTAKTGSGADAVLQAKAGKWKELASYCAEDARLTYEISTRKRLALPEGYAWRKKHNDRDHDPNKVLFMLVGSSYQIEFEIGTLPAASVIPGLLPNPNMSHLGSPHEVLWEDPTPERQHYFKDLPQ